MPIPPRNRRRSWSTLLVWLGAFLAGIAVAAIAATAVLLWTQDPALPEAVFALPRPVVIDPAPPGIETAKLPQTVPPTPAPPTPVPPTPVLPAPAAAHGEPAAQPEPHKEAEPVRPRDPARGDESTKPAASAPAAPDHPVAAASPPAVPARPTEPVPAEPSALPRGPGQAPSAAAGGGGGGGALAPAPDPQLIERTPDGVIPIIGPDGKMPWQAYARPFADTQARPRIAVVVNGLGLSDLATQNAIEKLPPEVSLGFSPYAKRLGDWMQLARTVGHEVLVDVPLEPDDPENQDPGPETLLSTLAPSRNIARLHAIMGRVTGYVGLVPSRSDRFANVPAAMRPVLEDLRTRGLLVLDISSTTLAAAPPSLVRVGADLVLDADPTRATIDQRLADLEAAAKRNGSSAGIGRPLPVTLAAVGSWAEGLSKRGFVLAPVTAIVRR